MSQTVVEWFCGIGGFSTAFPDFSAIAVDINRHALETYRLNFQSTEFHSNSPPRVPDKICHQHGCLDITSLNPKVLDRFTGCGWWLSPPCQPYTRRGNQKDLDDRRTQPLLKLIELIHPMRPAWIAMENVPDFAESRSRLRLIEKLKKSNYDFAEYQICPTEIGFPNRRRRYYLVATSSDSVCELRELELPKIAMKPVSHFVREDFVAETAVRDDFVLDYEGAIHLCDANDGSEITNCFTSAYGSSPVRSGSYLKQGDRVRRFSPLEVLALMGFPGHFRWPDDLTARQQWKLAGNSIHVAVVKTLLNGTLFPNASSGFLHLGEARQEGN